MARVKTQSTTLSATSMTVGTDYAGYYIGVEKTIIKGQERTLHVFKAYEGETKVTGDFKIWGTQILDDRLSSIPAGQLTFVQYLGKKGKAHSFEVDYDDELSIAV